REGRVEGNARIDLSFPVADINDLLKSLVLRDLDGGHIATVSYDSNAPVERTLKSFAVNLASHPTFGQILNQARDEKVEVGMQQTNATPPGTLTGTVVGIEQQQLKMITDDQTRLRANLKEMPPTAAAYKRYLEKFDQQETQIESLQADIKKLQDTEHQQQKEFEDFLNNFSAE